MLTLIYQWLTEVLGVPVYQDFIPESKPKPAASYFIVERDVERDLKGNPILRRITVQVSVTDVSRLECDELCEKLRAFDGCTDQENFQYITIISDTDEPRSDTSESFYTTNIELQLTP